MCFRLRGPSSWAIMINHWSSWLGTIYTGIHTDDIPLAEIRYWKRLEKNWYNWRSSTWAEYHQKNASLWSVAQTSGVRSPTQTLKFFSPGSSLLLLWFSLQRTGGFVFGIIFPFNLCITVTAAWSLAKLMKPYPAVSSENLIVITCDGGKKLEKEGFVWPCDHLYREGRFLSHYF